MILALDQGTTSSRAIAFDGDGRIKAVAQREYAQHYPQPGWVEHDPAEIWATQLAVAHEAIARAGAQARDIKAIGYQHVTLDLQGYRLGSLNEALRLRPVS